MLKEIMALAMEVGLSDQHRESARQSLAMLPCLSTEDRAQLQNEVKKFIDSFIEQELGRVESIAIMAQVSSGDGETFHIRGALLGTPPHLMALHGYMFGNILDVFKAQLQSHQQQHFH